MKMLADFATATGKVKPLHGVNNSPVTRGKPIETFRKAGIPYVRLHDSIGPYGGTYYVDVPNIFRNFDADSDDPASYDFAFTDAYLKGLAASGCKIFYRLGVTIENSWDIRAYRIYPPEDNLKWAKICEHIIRHYNEGWNSGFHYGIEYWEIWNEPENPPMWTGTREQFFELYRVASNHLKQQFPHLKFGGYASCGFYSVTREGTSDFYKSFLTYFDEFLQYISAKETSAPLDFFSWHLYTYSPREIILHGEYVRRKLDQYGFRQAENIFDEWHCTPKDAVYEECKFVDIKEEPGASGTAAAFALMQYSPIDKAMYYDALPTRSYCGLFYFPSLRPTKTYYSFLAFNVLYRLGTACKVENAGEDGVLCAAKNETAAALLAVNYNSESAVIDLEIKGWNFDAAQCFLIDKEHTFERVASLYDGKKLKMPPYSTLLFIAGDVSIDAVVDIKQKNVLNGIKERK